MICEIRNGKLFVEIYVKDEHRPDLRESKPFDHVEAALIEIIDSLQKRVEALENGETKHSRLYRSARGI